MATGSIPIPELRYNRTMSKTLRQQLDTTIRPQDDYFHHVNKTWLDASPIPDSESRWGSFFVLRDLSWSNMRQIYEELQGDQSLAEGSIEQKARDLYLTGMKVDTYTDRHLEIIQQLCEEIDKIKTITELVGHIGHLHKKGMSGPWIWYVDADDKDSAKHIFRLHQSGLTLPDRDYYIGEDEKMKEVRKKYTEHLGVIPSLFPGIRLGNDQFAEHVFAIEHYLATHSRTRIALRDTEKNYNKITAKSLISTYKEIDWVVYADMLGWEMSDQITVDQPEFFEAIEAGFRTFPLETWKTYLKWKVIFPLYGRVNEEFAREKFEFFGRVLSGTKEILPLWKRVVTTIDDCIGEGVGQLYVEKHFPESSKKAVLEMVERVREAYADRISALDWMEESTKQYALKKLANIKVLIGYPDTWREYTSLSITTQSYIDNLIACEESDTAYDLKKLHQPTSREEWFMYPQTVNAYHDPNRLVICFPAAILQPPFFDPAANDETNYGGIGSVIGHELTHGFDDQGCEFDAEGNMRSWRTTEDKSAFESRAKIIIDQANAFEVVPGVHLQGDLVIGEAIADLGGVEISLHALRAIQPELTKSQLEDFFIANAAIERGHCRPEKAKEYALTDPHPAEIFRINATLQHVDHFHATYKTKQGDKMYRDSAKRARIW